MEGIIYSYRSPNNKYYIGQTINADKRKTEHSKYTIKTKTKFGRSLKKYGYNNFDYTVLIRVSSTDKLMLHELLNFYEVMYIIKYDSYHNGYNSTRGGDGLSNSSVIIPIVQYSLEGEIIQEWESTSCASRELGIHGPHITSACKMNCRIRSAGGYLWSYNGDPAPLYRKREIKIYQYNLESELISVHDSINITVEKTGISKSLIEKNINNKSASTHGFIFTKDETRPLIRNVITPTIKSNSKSVLVFTKDGELISEYQSISALAKAFEITDKYASGVCNGRKKSCKGFILKFK